MCRFILNLFCVLKNLAFKYFILITWTVLSIYIFCSEFQHYHNVPEYYYLSRMLGTGLCVSRATATLIYINLLIIILLILNLTNKLVHQVLTKISKSLLKFYLEKIKWTHMIVGQMFVLMSIVHSAAHLSNGIFFVKRYNTTYNEINWAQGSNDSVLRLLFGTVTGLTGIFMLAIAIAMWIFSRESIRMRHYNFFYYFHHSFLVIIVLMLLHPMGNVIKYQTNTDRHVPGCSGNETTVCLEEPIFSPSSKNRLIYSIMTLVIFFLDKIINVLRKHNTILVNSTVINRKFISLSLNIGSNTNIVKPGQYILLKCNEISQIEWHPFSVIRFTDSDTRIDRIIEIMISVRGDWTNHLLCKSIGYEKFHLSIDGPFHSALEILADKKNVIFIAGGIGITPFISLLNYIIQANVPNPSKIQLIWISRDMDEFMVFSNFLTQTIESFWNSNWPDRLNVQLFITGDAAEEDFTQLGSYLASRLYRGRPRWKNIFKYFNSCFEKVDRVTIGCCGSASLSADIKQQYFQNSFKTRIKYNLIADGFN